MTKLTKSRMRLAALIASTALLHGCSLIPTESQSLVNQHQRDLTASKTTTDVVTAAKTSPPNVTITTTAKDGTITKIEQPVSTWAHTNAVTHTDESGNSDAAGSFDETVSIPLGVKLLMLAAGIAALIGILIWVRRASPAVRAATDMADGIIQDAIHRVRSQAMTTTDPAKTAELTTIAADLERDRGKLKA